MRRIILTLAVGVSILTSCNNDDMDAVSTENIYQDKTVDMDDFFIPTMDMYKESTSFDKSMSDAQGDITRCYSVQVLNRQLKENPSLYNKMYDIEYNSRQFISTSKKGGNNPKGNGGGPSEPISDNLGAINIPVYIHVVYSKNQENISDAQIQSQINVLNQDFRKQNSDVSNAPSEFSGLAADTEINFTLANVYRYANPTSSWGTNDQVKSIYPPISPQTHLNIWVCNIGGGILGYAQFPGGSSSTDGVVISPQYFGTTGYVSAPFDQGRTATHEVGHYLNLRHIWGDGRCRQDDFVSDTPSSDAPNYNCPSYPTVNCRSNDMTMNYMDYTNDGCMYMFTEGQKSRMRSIFASNGPRAAMAGN